MSESLRIDKWLWHARFCKTRSIAQEKAATGHIRLNGHRVEKASAAVRVGDVMTLPAGSEVISVKVRLWEFAVDQQPKPVRSTTFFRNDCRGVRGHQNASGTFGLFCIIA